MKLKKSLAAFLSLAMISASFVGCGGNNDGQSAESASAEASTDTSADASASEEGSADVKGEITVLTNRTDLVDTLFEDYAKEFNKKYPNVKVNFEALNDYEGDIQVRMGTTEYGDVLLMPTMDAKQYPDFFLPLGDQAELEKTYRTLTKPSYDGTTYGIPVYYTTAGVAYNKKVFEQAGITETPKTEEEFLNDMKLIKEKEPDVIPYYTNYADGWPLNQWEDLRLGVSGDPEFMTKIIDDKEPFKQGSVHYEIYKLMYDLVKEKLVEDDPVTSNWEKSKQMMADGKIGAMVLGSWAITQIQGLAENPDDIGYMPFPQAAPDGKMYASIQPDYNIAVNKNTKYPEAAKAYLWWFINESGFAESQSGIPQKLDSELPAALKDLETNNVTFITEAQPPVDKQGKADRIDQAGQIGFYQPDFKTRIVEAALGNTDESFDDIMNDLNAKWQAGQEEVASEE